MQADPIERINFLGGICRLPLQSEGQALKIQNVRPLVTGGFKTRFGQNLEHSIGADPTVGSITDLFGYHTDVLGTHLYSIRRTTAGDKFFDTTTEVTGPIMSGAKYTSIVEGKGTIFISNGDNADIQYHVPGTTTRAVITNSFSGNELPQCQHLKVYRNRLYAWTNTGLRYTNTGLYAALPDVHFSDANLIQVREENAEARGLAVGENILILFTPNSYSIMIGLPGNNGANTGYTLEEYQGIGCGSPRTITAQGKLVAWKDTERRIKLLEGPILRDLDEPNFIADYLQAADVPEAESAQFLGRELWVLLPKSSAAQERRILIYDLFLDKWIAEFTNIEGYAITYLPEINAVYIGSHTGGYIWRQAKGSYLPLRDSGSLIPIEIIDGQVLFKTLWHQKLFDKVLVATNMNWSENLNFSYAVDDIDDFTSFELNSTLTSAGHNWGEDNWGEHAWGSTGNQSKVLRPFYDRSLQAISMRLKMDGDVIGGTVVYGMKYYGSLLDRDGEAELV